MSYILTDLGEEWYTETAVGGVTVTFTLYNDSNDNVSDGDDIAAITEPSGGSYTRESSTISVVKSGGDWGFQNDSQMTFNTSDSSLTVDGAAFIVSFQADETSDGSATNHLVATAQLSQSRDLSQVDELVVSAGEATVTVN
jgi:hypothetical protein